jgi:hypothetical protein
LITTFEINGAIAAHTIKLTQFTPTRGGTGEQGYFAIGFSFEKKVIDEHSGRNHDELLSKASLAFELDFILISI